MRDALVETSVNGDASTTSFFMEYSNLPMLTYPFLERGANHANGVGAGNFAFYSVEGNAHSVCSGRVVLCGL